jgi:hypothetical protein
MNKVHTKNYFICLLISLINIQAMAQISTIKILPNDTNRDQEFGHSVSVSGNYAVVGTIEDDENGVLAGAVYIFKHSTNGWMQTQKLFGNDTDANDGFGYSVSMDSNRLVVGANIIDTGGLTNAGAVYIFALNDGIWAQVDKLIANTPTADARFGTAVSLYADNLVIGSPGINNDTGSAYIFTYDNGTMQWTQGDTLLDNNSLINDKFGISVSIYEDRVLVGADTGPFNNLGSYATIFENLSNLEQNTLTANDSTNANRFGFTVSLFATKAVIGAFNDRGIPSSVGSGSAYIFEFNTMTLLWEQSQKLAAFGTTATDNTNFGNAVSIHGDKILVGSLRARPNGSSSGSAFLFKFDGMVWNQTEIAPSEIGNGDQFGFSVTLSNRWALIGANLDDNTIQNPNTGSASLFDVDSLFFDSFE